MWKRQQGDPKLIWFFWEERRSLVDNNPIRTNRGKKRGFPQTWKSITVSVEGAITLGTFPLFLEFFWWMIILKIKDIFCFQLGFQSRTIETKKEKETKKKHAKQKKNRVRQKKKLEWLAFWLFFGFSLLFFFFWNFAPSQDMSCTKFWSRPDKVCGLFFSSTTNLSIYLTLISFHSSQPHNEKEPNQSFLSSTQTWLCGTICSILFYSIVIYPRLHLSFHVLILIYVTNQKTKN